ncbi:MAG: DNA topoisomerase IV subunit B [Victivallaceae bacterium]|nr:DNA topoisomerase IV subunit B [Victivallaceae bacterium]MDD4317629.1 DNA topoisomerase IV subunit B [Victivallaceae bacterium]MDD5662856.1 DNA topoisomerase IV subunit B [Victivallaceae bacterium]
MENKVVNSDIDILPDNSYTGDHIKTLSSLEHIRLRPGMYIGRLGDGSHPDDGIYVMLKEVIDNAVDEYIMGAGRRIDISIEDRIASVRDYGRGIPLEKLAECVSQVNTGGKFNDDVFQFSIGMNGVGTKAVNALSQNFTVRAIRKGTYREVLFKSGVLADDCNGATEEPNGTIVAFEPDLSLFPNFQFHLEYIEKRLWMYAYLNSGLSLGLNGKRFFSRNGLKDLITTETGEDRHYEIIAFKDKALEFAFCHTNNYSENYYSFVNGQHTTDGGTHLSAFKEGLLKAINEYSGKNYQANDVRDGIVAAVAIKLKDPVFESQTKNKLGNTDIRMWIVNTVKDSVEKYLHMQPDEAELLMAKVAQNETVRKQVQAVKKMAKENARKTSIKIPKLRDSKFHLGDRDARGEKSMIFLTEGDSAAGSLVSCRDVMTQAVFSLKGKPLNTFGMGIDTAYKNEELYCISRALNIEDDIENLRYNKIIIATDADVDGLHIRNLLITFFLTFYEQLVLSEHLFVLETPLFRVRNKQETVYCYSEIEREDAVAKLKRGGIEITRFKGLGEISPDEFGQFIGEDIRLSKVTVDHMRDVPQMLKFYMGDNTPERREYIMTNLEIMDNM